MATAVAMVAMGIGGGLQAMSSIQQGKMQNQVGEYNARVAEENAKAVQVSANYETKKLAKDRDEFISTQRALLGKSGALVGDTSPLMLLEETASEYETDIQNIKYSSDVQSQQLTSQAALERAQGKYYKQAGYTGAVTGLLSSTANIALLKSRKSNLMSKKS